MLGTPPLPCADTLGSDLRFAALYPGSYLMKMYPALSLLAAALATGWLMFGSTYDFRTYAVEGCTQPVTAVTYRKAFHRGQLVSRGVAFVPGIYRTREIPSSACLILPELSGFDAHFEVIPTCENGRIVLTSYYTQLESPGPSNAIVSRALLDNAGYLQFRAIHVNYVIVLE